MDDQSGDLGNRKRINMIAASANAAAYGSSEAREYADGAPHIKHAALRELYGRIVLGVFDFAATYSDTPSVLDLGAGEGTVTLPFLELGAKVTAVDVSESQLGALRARCADYASRVETRCQDVFEALASIQLAGEEYDIVVASSFLHHVPDYLSLIRQSVAVLSPCGQFFSFQDPLRYDTMGWFARSFSTLAYLSWRIFRGDVVGGMGRRLRRARGVYDEDCPLDSCEYHVIRGGVDQAAIRRLFEQLGLECEIIRYFSTQGLIWHPIGSKLGIRNTFAVIARRCVHRGALSRQLDSVSSM